MSKIYPSGVSVVMGARLGADLSGETHVEEAPHAVVDSIDYASMTQAQRDVLRAALLAGPGGLSRDATPIVAASVDAARDDGAPADAAPAVGAAGAPDSDVEGARGREASNRKPHLRKRPRTRLRADAMIVILEAQFGSSVVNPNGPVCPDPQFSLEDAAQLAAAVNAARK